MEQNICSICHQPILSEYYFCPNCGNNLKPVPLSTTVATQVWIYIFSIILPMICFIFVTRWKGIKYLKSNDPKAKIVGQIACVLLFVSTIVTIWLAYNWTEQFVQSQIDSINTDFAGF